jgi:SP family xylose:H+ symportor-like MFS transporter
MTKQNNGDGLYVMAITLVATLGGLLFGYDTAVISGAVNALKVYFIDPKNLDINAANTLLGWTTSSALLGCIIGGAIAGIASHSLGRKKALILTAILFFISAIGTAVPKTLLVFVVFRIVGGIGVGMASMLSPMYIAEIAPASIRGKLVSWNQFAIIFGMLVVYFVNYFIALQGDDTWLNNVGWRWMFASEAVPSFLFLISLLFIPESPRWLMMKSLQEKALSVLCRVGGENHAKLEAEEIKKSLLEKKGKLFSCGFLLIFIGIMLSVFQQVTGINVILYYAPEIFRKMGSTTNASLLQTVIVGAVNLLFTVIAILTVDKFGRKVLMIIGYSGMFFGISGVGMTAFFQQQGLGMLMFMLLYIACFALAAGPVTWVLLSEIFPNKIRDKAMSIAVAAQWISNLAVSWTFPILLGNIFLTNKFHGGFPFWIYGSMCIITVLFVLKLIPETKGKTLEEMENLWKKTYKSEVNYEKVRD